MKITKLIGCALCAAVLAAFFLVGCEESEIFSIDAPSDLQSRIDSIAAARAGNDTTFIDITTKVVGAEDNSTPWWTVWSDYFAVPVNKRLVLEFVNYGNGANDWNNWVVVTANGERGAEGYAEHFAFRSDAEGWSAGNSNFDPALISDNLPVDPLDLNSSAAAKADFLATMNGASVKLEIDHSRTGYLFLSAKSVGTNGKEITLSYNQPIESVDEINAFLACDGSHYVMKRAYLLPSQVTVVEDVNPVKIVVAGTPALVEIGSETIWGDATATVTFADGSSEEVDSVDLSFNVIPDLTTTGVKTVSVAYSKTKKGAYGKAVSTIYTLEVKNSIVSIAATDINYYYFSSNDIIFKPKGIVVTATYSDGSTAVLEDNVLDFEYPATIPSTAGSQTIDITYVGVTSTVTTTSTVTLVKGISQVGANDFSSPFWTNSADFTVASGASKTFTLYCYSDNLENYHSPYTILRNAANTSEYAVVRMDNFGWGSGFGAAALTSDWNWPIFKSSISGSKIVIKVTNNGNNTADILYNVTYATGETHFQKYAGIAINSADLNCAVGTEKSYLVMIN